MRKVPPLRCDALATHHNQWGFRGVEQVRSRFRAVVGNKAWRSPYYATAREAAEAAVSTSVRALANPRLLR